MSIGNITLGDIMGILPFEDPIVVLELDGESIWAALESSLSAWPAQEGCDVMQYVYIVPSDVVLGASRSFQVSVSLGILGGYLANGS